MTIVITILLLLSIQDDGVLYFPLFKKICPCPLIPFFLLLPFIRIDEENIGKCWLSSPTLWNASVPEGKPKTKFSM